jgi:ribonuclease HIII
VGDCAATQKDHRAIALARGSIMARDLFLHDHPMRP